MQTTIYNQQQIHARRQPFMGNRIDLLLIIRDVSNGVEKLSIAQPLTLTPMPAADDYVEPRPTVSLQPHAAQQLMDELWQCGLRPTEGTGSAGSLAATERHLADLQKLVFGHTVKPNQNQMRYSHANGSIQPGK